MRTERRRHTLAAGLLYGSALSLGVALAALPQALAAPAPAAAGTSDYDLAWKAFLAAGKLDDAVALARRAVREHPQSILWHRRLASAAEQNSDGPLAARSYAWLASSGRQYDLLAHAIQLAEGTQQDDAVIHLMQVRALHEPYRREHWLQLVDAMLNAGRFQPLLDLLRRADHAHPRRFYLEQQARVYAVIGKPHAQKQVLQRLIARYGAAPAANLQVATTEFIDNHLHQALATLKQAQALVAPTDNVYWQTLGSLAWMLQDIPASSRAGRELVRSGKATMSDYDRLFQTHIAKRPGVAYAYALVGWTRLRAPVLFFDALTAVDQMDAQALRRAVFASVRAADLNLLGEHPSFWSEWAQEAALHGHEAQARARYLRALQLAPDDVNAEAGYLWLLIDSNDIESLATVVDRLGREQPRSERVREALAAAQAMLGRPTRALALMRPAYHRHRHDAAWLVQYASLLEQVGRGDTARAVRMQAVRALSMPATTPPSTPTEAATQRLLRQQTAQELAAQLTPGDPARRATARLLTQASRQRVRNQVLSWSTSLDNPEASRLWLHLAYRHAPPPLWAQLGQALADRNDSAAARLLRRQRARLPHHDRVDAATRLGWRPLATTLAFNALDGEPGDIDLAHTYRDLALQGSDHVGAGSDWQRTSGVTRYDHHVDARLWLNHSLALDADLHAMHDYRYDVAQIGPVPSQARHGTVTLTQYLPRGERGVSIGGGRDLAGYQRLGAFYDYRLTHYLNLGARIDYGAPLDDTTPLAVAGLADSVAASADYRFSAWDTVSARLNVARLRAQGGGQLGRRQRLELEYRHRIWLAPPSITLIASAADARYQQAADLPAQLRRLLPSGEPPSTSFLVPQSYAQACAGIGYNAEAEQDWQPRLRLFGVASVCRNSVAGRGASVSAGLVTPVVGNDRLVFGFGYGNNTGASASRTLTATISYRYDFTP